MFRLVVYVRLVPLVSPTVGFSAEQEQTHDTSGRRGYKMDPTTHPIKCKKTENRRGGEGENMHGGEEKCDNIV